MSIKQFEVEFKIPKMLLNNSRKANPLDTYYKQLKILSGKRNKTDADLVELAIVEIEGSLYVNSEGYVTLNENVIEANIHNGAKKSKEGKLALEAVWVDEVSELEFDGSRGKNRMTAAEVARSEAHHHSEMVNVQKSKVLRNRPILRNVTGSFIVSLDTEIVNAEVLKKWIDVGLNRCGLGDNRPRFGRGELVSFKEVK